MPIFTREFLILVLVLVFLGGKGDIELCNKDCPCIDDSPCKYFCKNGKCADRIAYKEKCAGFLIHSRECGYNWCDPKTCKCEFTYSTGDRCEYHFSCSSGYCDSTFGTCQYRRPSEKVKTDHVCTYSKS